MNLFDKYIPRNETESHMQYKKTLGLVSKDSIMRNPKDAFSNLYIPLDRTPEDGALHVRNSHERNDHFLFLD